jgi:hypothetical protein
MLSYIATPGGITAVIRGEAFTVTSDNPVYNQVLDALRNNEPDYRVEELFRTANAIKRFSKGNIEVVNDSELRYKGEVVHNVVVDRILKFMTEGLPVEPLIAFLNRLLENPSRRSIEELYTFLEHQNLPITPEGKFLAYKGVTEELKDVHSGKFDNSVGQTHSMPRSKVDDDFRKGCSFGFHVGTIEYASSWGPRVMLVEVDPADVVSVPSDCSCQKLRTAKYSVVAEAQGALTRPLHSASNPYEEEAIVGDDDFVDDTDVDGGYAW